METLEILYDIKHKNNHFFDRKFKFISKKTLLKGLKKSGKTSLIIDYLQNFSHEEILYIDLDDTRVDRGQIAKNLVNFTKTKPLKILVIENYDKSFKLPDIEEIILTCKDDIEGFDNRYLYPLDFEEFISFDTRHSNIEHLFNLYANKGTYPQILINNSNSVHWAMQEMLKLMLNQKHEFEIFKALSIYQSSKVSAFSIYNSLKDKIKISKDKLYEKINNLQNEKMIFLIQKYNSPRSPKKLYLIDFALKNALTFKKEFLKRFENMVFLELIKRDKTIFYTEFIDIFLPHERKAIYCIPFLPQELIYLKIKKILKHLKDLEVEKIEIITVGNEGGFEIESISCEIVPYWQWALGE